MTAAPHMLESYKQMDAALAAAGVPPTSDAWLAEVERHYMHATAADWIGRIGRGAGKSFVLVKLAVNDVVFGDFTVPRGERHYHVHASATARESYQRVDQFGQYLEILGVQFDRVDDTVELRGAPRGFRTLPCTTTATRGFRAFGWSADELASFRNSDGIHNAPTVVGNLRAMSVTHPGARGRGFSSPLGTSDFHFELIERGETEHQIVTIGPTWAFSPIVTEADTHRLEPDPKVWSREYAAIPQSALSSAFDETAVRRAFREVPRDAAPLGRYLICDPSSGRKDSWTWGVAGYSIQSTGEPVLVFEMLDGLGGRFWDQVSSAEVVKSIVDKVCRPRKIVEGYGDQREAFALTSEFHRNGLSYNTETWTAQSKPDAIEKLRRLFAESRIILPEHEALRKELLSFEERITSSGAITFAGRGSAHDDYVALLITACMADLPQVKPTTAKGSVHIVDPDAIGAGYETMYATTEPVGPGRTPRSMGAIVDRYLEAQNQAAADFNAGNRR